MQTEKTKLEGQLQQQTTQLLETTLQAVSGTYEDIVQVLNSPEAQEWLNDYYMNTSAAPSLAEEVAEDRLTQEQADEILSLLRTHLAEGYVDSADAWRGGTDCHDRVEQRISRLQELRAFDTRTWRELRVFMQHRDEAYIRPVALLLQQKRARAVAGIHTSAGHDTTPVPTDAEPLSDIPAEKFKNFAGLRFWHIFRHHPLVTAIASQEEITEMENVLIQKCCQADLFSGGRESWAGTAVAHTLGTLQNPNVIPPFVAHIRATGPGHTSAAVLRTLKQVIQTCDPKCIDAAVANMDPVSQGIVALMRNPQSAFNTLDNDSMGYAACGLIAQAERTLSREQDVAILRTHSTKEPRVLQAFLNGSLEPEELEQCIVILAEHSTETIPQLTERYFEDFAKCLYPGGDCAAIICRVARLLECTHQVVFNRIKQRLHLRTDSHNYAERYAQALVGITQNCQVDNVVLAQEFDADILGSIATESPESAVTTTQLLNRLRGEPLHSTVADALAKLENDRFTQPLRYLDTLQAVAALAATDTATPAAPNLPAIVKRVLPRILEYTHPHVPASGPAILAHVANMMHQSCTEVFATVRAHWDSSAIRNIPQFLEASARTAELIAVPERQLLEPHLGEVITAVQDPEDFAPLATYEQKLGLPEHTLLKRLAKERKMEFIKLASRAQWQIVVGEPMAAFLEALPKRTDEKRNAFTHNPYDRTTPFVYRTFQRQDALGVDADSMTFLAGYVQRFGLSETPVIFDYYRNLHLVERGQLTELPPEQQATGVTTLAELETRYHRMHERICAHEPMLDVANLSTFDVDLLSSASGKSTHTFGGRHSMESMVARFATDVAAGKILPAPAEYTAAAIPVDDVRIEFDPATLARALGPIAADVITAIDSRDDWTPLCRQAQACCQAELDQLAPKRQGNKFIEQQCQQWENIMSRLIEAKSPDEAMAILVDTPLKKAQSTGLLSVCRCLVLHKAITQGFSGDAVLELRTRAADAASPQAALSIMNVLNNTGRDHVLRLDAASHEHYWTPATLAKLCAAEKKKGVVHCSALFEPESTRLAEAIEQFTQHSLQNSRDMQIIPDRGFIGELSAYLANACYSREYPLLQWQPPAYAAAQKVMPPVVPYKFVRPSTESTSELMGSALLFELEAADGTPVLLVRPFNVPREDEIDIESFIERSLDHFAAVAKRRGCRRLLVPGVSGSISNYPRTYGYLQRMYCTDDRRTPLRHNFSFNGYDITNQCFVAREIEPEPVDTTTTEE